MIAGSPIPDAPDAERMRRARFSKLQEQLERAGADGLLLTGSSGVAYATGALSPGLDSGMAHLARSVALVLRGNDEPHLWTPFPEGAPDGLPPDLLHPAEPVASPEGASRLVAQVKEIAGSGAPRLACDELTHQLREALDGCELSSAAALLGGAKLCKTPDELAAIRAAQRINELAMCDVQSLVKPGARQSELTAVFLQRVMELGATSNAIDPIWQVMPASLASGPWTTHGDVAFPTPSADRLLRHGDVVWVDTGIQYLGYASDFGRTWVVGAETGALDRRRAAQHERWAHVVSEVLARCKPGVTALELARAATAANGGVKPWLEHFYLAHGVGTDSAEMPLIGTDLGEAFDEAMVMQPGMVLVLEPVIWEDGYSGYRSEDIFAVTDEGWEQLSSYPYHPFEGSW